MTTPETPAAYALYGYWRSSSSWRVRVALELKGLPYDNRPVHLIRDGGQQHVPAFGRKNAMNQIPVLEITDGPEVHHVSQSLAIMEFLEQRHPQVALLPGDALERAHVRQLSEIINAGTQPLQNLAVIQALRDELGQDHVAWCQRWIAKGLEAFEATLKAHDGSFCAGATPTMADACLIPQLYNARRFNLDLSQYPRLLRIEQACASLPAFERAHPDAQPDAVV